MGTRVLLLLTLLVAVRPATTHATSLDEPSMPSGACVQTVDEQGAAIPTLRVKWRLRAKPNERRKLDAHCDVVGPIVVRAIPETSRARDARDGIAVVGWNVHVGGGDIMALVRRLEAGTLTGAPVGHYVLLLQEVYRSNGGIPAVPVDLRVPRRIAPRTPTHPRDDIVAIARRLNLSLYYVPSMRNGRDAPFEDRGNAILSTLPLEDLTAIELPMGRQRRVAISAKIRGVDRAEPAAALQVSVVHLDALAGPSRLWIFATGWRSRQARAILEHLAPHTPAILAGDLNTWFLGRWEPAYRQFARSFPETRPTTAPLSARAGGRLDVLFYRLRPSASNRTWTPRDPCGTPDPRCGSDHRPIVGIETDTHP